jgi:hypothetical protein
VTDVNLDLGGYTPDELAGVLLASLSSGDAALRARCAAATRRLLAIGILTGQFMREIGGALIACGEHQLADALARVAASPTELGASDALASTN